MLGTVPDAFGPVYRTKMPRTRSVWSKVALTFTASVSLGVAADPPVGQMTAVRRRWPCTSAPGNTKFRVFVGSCRSVT